MILILMKVHNKFKLMILTKLIFRLMRINKNRKIVLHLLILARRVIRKLFDNHLMHFLLMILKLLLK